MRGCAGGGFWNLIGGLNDNFGLIGYIVIAVFVRSWGLSALIYRLKRFEDLEVQPGTLSGRQ